MNIDRPSREAATDTRPFILSAKTTAALFVLMLAAVLVMVATGCDDSTRDSVSGKETVVIFQTADGEVDLDVEVARTEAERSRGLMHRSELAADSGMIFVWEHPTQGGFWMKDTLIPLSIAFIAADGTIIDIQNMEPQTLVSHSPGRPYNYAIEVNWGYFTENGIEPGDRADLSALD